MNSVTVWNLHLGKSTYWEEDVIMLRTNEVPRDVQGYPSSNYSTLEVS